MPQQSPLIRAMLGFVAAAIATFTFHQAMWAVLWGIGLMPAAPFPMAPTHPFGVPRIFSLAFWGGLYGAIFGLFLPRIRWPLWQAGIVLGIIAALVGLFIVNPLKHLPVAYGFAWRPWVISLLINGCWGLGVGIILPLLMPRAPRTA
jgi:hypothetical protein